jgi:ethanolamine utilization microcompartment shell protein EutS
MEREGEAITRKAIERALEGDTTSLRLCMERIYPPRKSRPVTLALPKIETSDDVAKAQGTVIGAMAIGDITPEEANVVAGVLEAKRRSIETCEIEARMTVLEQMKS